MSFQRRLFFTITFVLMVLLVGNIIVTTVNSRAYFSTQLAVVANDAATSLAFGISTAAREKDLAQIESMMDVMFDSGYYLSIHYIDIEGNLVSSRARRLEAEVPDWFTAVVRIPLSTGVAEVVSGWYQLGQVRMIAHPGFAYKNLWHAFTELLWLFLFGLVLSYGLLGLALHLLLRPLRHLEAQANAISKKDFVVGSEQLGSPEFRRVTSAMNRMALKIGEMFSSQATLTDSLREEVSQDQLTKLLNRIEFDARLRAWLSSDDGKGPGALALVSIAGLDNINAHHGRIEGDQCIQDIADTLRESMTSFPLGLLARHAGTDFAVYIPGIDEKELHRVLVALKTRLEQCTRFAREGKLTIYFGGASFISEKPLERVFAAADESMRRHRQGERHNLIIQLDDTSTFRSASDWKESLQDAIAKEAFVLVYHSVFVGDMEAAHHCEVLCRYRDRDALVPANVFWPAVERFDLNVALDKYILSSVLDKLLADPECRLSVNISGASAADAHFRLWLAEVIGSARRSELERLYLELPERLLGEFDGVLQPIIVLCKHHGIGVIVDRFGLMPTSIAFLQEIDIDFVKIDRRFVLGLDSTRENRLYIRALMGICLSCEIGLIAEGVETKAVHTILSELGVNGQQGFYLSMPEKQPD